jgi:sialate O-acetylesterase
LKGFAIAGADKKWAFANARIEGDKILLSHESIKAPLFVRYAWADNTVGNLFNGAGLPAGPFRTDKD